MFQPMKKWMLGRIVFLFATASAVAAETLPVTFRLHAPDAKIVAVAGEFNDWDATSLPMRKSTNGDWSASIRVPAGDYGYKFVVDGQWTFDPAQPLRKFVDQLENSRLVVGESVANEAAAASAPSPARRKPSAD